MVSPKYRVTRQGLRADRSGAALFGGSVLVASLVAQYYEVALPRVARGSLGDLGAGTSPLREFYGPLVDRAWAVDWPSTIHNPVVHLFGDLNTGIPFRTGSLDTAVLSDVLEHLREPKLLLLECHRVLRRGGFLVGNVPFMYWLHEEPHDYFRYTEHGLRLLLEEAGFRSIDVTVIGGGVDVLVDTGSKIAHRVPLVGRLVSRVLQSVWMALRSLPIVRRRLGGMERRFPLAYGFTAEA